VLRKFILLALVFVSSPAWATNYCADPSVKVCVEMNTDESPIQDQSGNDHDGTLDSANNPDFVSNVPPGYAAGGSYDFSSDKISFGDHADFSPEAGASGIISIVVWVNFDTLDVTEGGRQFVVSKGGGGGYEYAINSNGNGTTAVFSGRIWTSGGTDIGDVDSVTKIKTGVDYCVGMTYSKADGYNKIYVQGALEATHTAHIGDGTASDGSSNLLLGARDDAAGTASDQKISRFVMFSRILSDAEHLDICQHGPRGTDTGVVYSTLSLTTATADTWLDVANPTTNHGTDTTMGTINTSNDNSELVKFDYSTLPVGATVYQASMTLYQTTREGAHNITAKRLLRNWVETEATQNIYSSGNSWGTAGALNATDASATGAATTSAGNVEDVTWVDVTTMINDQLSGNNYGFIIRPSSGVLGDQFSTREESTAGQRPRMSIKYYTAGSAGAASGSGTVAITGGGSGTVNITGGGSGTVKFQ
jgi:hypothetical protein